MSQNSNPPSTLMGQQRQSLQSPPSRPSASRPMSSTNIFGVSVLNGPPTTVIPTKINYKKETLAKKSFKELNDIGYTIKRSKTQNNFGKFFYYNMAEKSFYAWASFLTASQYQDWFDSLRPDERTYWETQNMNPFEWLTPDASPPKDEDVSALEKTYIMEEDINTEISRFDPNHASKMAPSQRTRSLLFLSRTPFSFLVAQGFEDVYSPNRHFDTLLRLVKEIHAKPGENYKWEVAYHALLCYIVASWHENHKDDIEVHLDRLLPLQILVKDPGSAVPAHPIE